MLGGGWGGRTLIQLWVVFEYDNGIHHCGKWNPSLACDRIKYNLLLKAPDTFSWILERVEERSTEIKVWTACRI